MQIKDEHLAKLLLIYSFHGTTLVCTDGTHYKFWNIFHDENSGSIITTWGRIGSKPMSNVKQINSRLYVEAMIRKKMNEGYELFSKNWSHKILRHDW